jgi:hypothetical protein
VSYRITLARPTYWNAQYDRLRWNIGRMNSGAMGTPCFRVRIGGPYMFWEFPQANRMLDSPYHVRMGRVALGPSSVVL